LSRKHAGEMRQLVVSISNTELNIRQFALVCTGAGKLTANARPKRTTLPAIRTRCGIGRRWPCSRRSRCTCSRIREIAHGSCSGSTSDSRLATANIRRRCSRSEASSNARCLVCGPRRRKSPFSRQAEGAHWWRRRDSRFRLFRDGLDYAFIPQSLVQLRERGVLSGSSLRILVPALVSRRQPVYESLQGGPEVGPLSTPRRYRCRRHRRRWPAPSGFADVSPVVTSPSRVKATLLDRTRVRKHYATGHYMLSPFFDSRHALPEGQGRRTASYRAF
jgi:hypothetical protein